LKHAKREAEGVASDNLAKPEEAVIAQLANASMTKKIETVRRVASRLGISDAAKMLTPKPRRKRTYS
jgi:ribosome-binding protein aMBF1 (putative translation factor)